jgi:HD-like signal output (HDOD) protein/ActR/RegA family two-component response regulator
VRNILFVDDEPSVLDDMREALLPLGGRYSMVFAGSGRAALERLALRRFDAVVTDMRMPGMDGSALLAAVQAQHPTTIRIVLSGIGELAVVQAASTAHLFLAKPCGAAELMTTIDRACRRREPIGDETLLGAVVGASALPSVPKLHARLNEVLADPATTTREVAAILAQDMAFSAKVLQIANSPVFHAGRGVTSAARAAMYVGLPALRVLAAAAPSVAGSSIEDLQRHSLLVARIAVRIAEDARLPGRVFTAGLLHDVGKLVHAPRSAHAEAGGCLLGLWGLPDLIVEAVAHHHHPERASPAGMSTATVIFVADGLAHEVAPASGAPPPAVDDEHLARIGAAGRLPMWRRLAATTADDYGGE